MKIKRLGSLTLLTVSALVSYLSATNINNGYNAGYSDEEALAMALRNSSFDGGYSYEKALEEALRKSLAESNSSTSSSSVSDISSPTATTSSSVSTSAAIANSPKYNKVVFGGVRGEKQVSSETNITTDKNALVVNVPKAACNADIRANAFSASDLNEVKNELNGAVNTLHFEKMGFGFPIAWLNVVQDIASGKSKEQINWKFLETLGYLMAFPDINKPAFDYVNDGSDSKNLAEIYASMLVSGGKIQYESYLKDFNQTFKSDNVFFGPDGLSHYTSLIPNLQMIVNESSSLKKYVSGKGAFVAHKSKLGSYSPDEVLRLDIIDPMKALKSIFGSAFDANGEYKLKNKVAAQALARGGSSNDYKYKRTLESHYYLSKIYDKVLSKAGFKDINVELRYVTNNSRTGEPLGQLVVTAIKK